MDSTRTVSPDVSFNVSLDVSSESLRGSPRTERRTTAGNKPKSPSPGKYLVRSGSVYLFQIRMPEDIGGSPARVLRIGLGALTARQARARAELLAALARDRFEQMRMARMNDETSARESNGWTMFDADSPEIAAAEVKGYLKAMQAILSQPAPPTPPHQQHAFASIRDLVALNRELARGPDANPLVANNAELLKKQSIARINETVDILEKAGSLGPSPKQQMQAIIAAQDAERTERSASEHEAQPAGEEASDDPEETEAASVAVHVVEPSVPSGVVLVSEPPSQVEPPSPIEHVEETAVAATAAAAKSYPWVFPVLASAIPSAPGSPVIIYRDEDGKIIPPFKLDRRIVERRPSTMPRLSEIAEEYMWQERPAFIEP